MSIRLHIKLLANDTTSDDFKLLYEVFIFFIIFCLQKEILAGRVGIPRPRESDLLNLKGSRQSQALRINSDSSNALYSYHFRLIRFYI